MRSPHIAGLPRIRIAPTLANDLNLMLQLLPFSRELASLVTDPREFVREHRAELRFLDQLGRAQIKRLRPQPLQSVGKEEKQETSPADAAPSTLIRPRMLMLR